MASSGNGHERQEAEYMKGDAVASRFQQGDTSYIMMERSNRMARAHGQWIAMDEDDTMDIEAHR